MRLLVCVGAIAALVSSSAGAQQGGDLARENRLWDIAKTRDIRAFSALLAPDFVAVYAAAINNKPQEIAAIRSQRLRSYAISGFSSRSLAPNVELVTYSVDAVGRFRGADISGRYHATSVWKRSGRTWQLAYHGEVKAQ